MTDIRAIVTGMLAGRDFEDMLLEVVDMQIEFGTVSNSDYARLEEYEARRLEIYAKFADKIISEVLTNA